MVLPLRPDYIITHFFLVGLIGRGLRTALIIAVSKRGVRRPWIREEKEHRRYGGANSPYCLIEHALQVPLCKCRTLKILNSLDIFCGGNSLLMCNWRHSSLAQIVLRNLIISQVELRTYKNNGHAWCMVFNLGIPLGSSQSKRGSTKWRHIETLGVPFP